MDATIVQTMHGDAPIASDDASSPPPADTVSSDNPPDAAPMTCNGGVGQCPLPPPACVDAGVTLLYQGGYCNGGICSWQTTSVDCASGGGTCIAGTPDGVLDAGPDAAAGVWAVSNGCLYLVSSPAAPPATPCSESADASDVCPLPQSVCADSRWLVYYDNGRCVAGSCVWESHYTPCPLDCQGHYCMLLVTPK